jgi:SPP1 family phage portal protein
VIEMPTEMQTISEIIEANAPLTLEQIIKLEIDEWKASPGLKLMQQGRNYYKADHDIKDRKRLVIGEGGALVENRNLSNRKLIHTFIRKLVDQKVGYLLSKELSIQTENEEYGELLGEVFDKKFLRMLKNIGKDAINAGIAWVQVYYDEEGNLSFKRHQPEEIIPLWKDGAHTELDALVRVYDVDYYIGPKKHVVTKVEFWDATGVRRYMLNAPGLVAGSSGLIPDTEAGEYSSHFVAQTGDTETPLNWERIPFIAFKYNDDEIPLIKILQSLVDEYDLQTSDNANNLADVPNAIYVIKDYDGTDLGEFRQNLTAYRAVKTTGEGGVDTLELELNPEALEKHLDRLRKDIYEFGRGVDTQSEKIGSSPSGIALRFLYSDLDMDANDIENEFQAALEQLLWFVNQHIANTTEKDFSDESVDFIFNRDIVINETEAVTNVKNSVGVISDKTLVSNHPFVTDSAEELKRLSKQKKDELKQMEEYAGLGGAGGTASGAGSG